MLFRISATAIMLMFALVGSAVGQVCQQRRPLSRRVPPSTVEFGPGIPRVHQWIDVGVPVDPDGDPGSGSFGSAPFGPTGESGVIFEAQQPFGIGRASIALGVVGSAAIDAAVFELAQGTTDRIALVALTTATPVGVQPFNVFDRISGGGAGWIA